MSLISKAKLAKLFVLGLSMPLLGADLVWTDPTGLGNWEDGSKWSMSTAPASGTDAFLIHTGVVNFLSQSFITGGSTMSRVGYAHTGIGTPAQLVLGHGSMLTISSTGGQMAVGMGNTAGVAHQGTLVVNEGAELNYGATLTIGRNGGSGRMEMTGGIVRRTAGNFYLSYGEGTNLETHSVFEMSGGVFEMLQGGFFMGYRANAEQGSLSQAAHGKLYLSGTADMTASMMQVGAVGAGSSGYISITDTAKLTHAGNMILGQSEGTFGKVEMDGGILIVNSGILHVGNSGKGVFQHSSGSIQLNGTNQSLSVGSASTGDGEYLMSGGTLNLVHNLRVGVAGTGKFTMTAGSVTIGNSFGSAVADGGYAEVEISGGSFFQNAGGLYIGEVGQARFKVNGTADLSANNLLLGSGVNGDGVLEQSGGAVLIRGNNSSSIGLDASAQGSYQMSGGTFEHSSTGSAAYFIVGNSGIGEFIQSAGSVILRGNGGYVAATETTVASTGNSILLGDKLNSQGRYEMSGGTFLSQQVMRVGNQGSGTIILTGGTMTVNQRLGLAYGASSTALVEVSGGHLLQQTSDSIIIGGNGEATFKLSQTGQVTSRGVVIGNGVDARGRVEISGGQWTNNGANLLLGNAWGSQGVMVVSGGVFHSANTIQLAMAHRNTDTASAHFGKTSHGELTVTGGRVSTNGSIGVGLGTGSTSIVNVSGGELQQLGSNVFFVGEIAGATSTLNVLGTGIVEVRGTSNGLKFGKGTGTINLDAGVIKATYIAQDSEGNGTFNFNGGLLMAGNVATNLMNGVTQAYVKSGGARIDTQMYNRTLGQSLLHDTSSSDGGLTKYSTGTLTMTGNHTYRGGTLIEAGTLALTSTV